MKRLTAAQRLELIAGPDVDRPSRFGSDRARYQAYLRFQHELHEGLAPGRRPWAFWAYLGGGQPPLADEQRRLAELGLLLPDEEAAIVSAVEAGTTDAALLAAAAIIRSRR